MEFLLQENNKSLFQKFYSSDKNFSIEKNKALKKINSDKSDYFLYANEENNNLVIAASIDEEEKDPILVLKVYANKQYEYDQNTFVAEGNAKAVLNGGNLLADRIEFDRDSQILIAEGNIKFARGSQTFRAERLSYNYLKKEGEIYNVYGIFDVKNLINDYNIYSELEILKRISNDFEDKDIKLSLIDGYKINFGKTNNNLDSIAQINDTTKSISAWRFKSPLIEISQNGWKASEMIFSNDPIDPTQIDIKALEVVSNYSSDEPPLITSSNSILILDKKIKIPIGKRSFGSSEENKSKYKFGFDFKDRDGFFISRMNDSIKLGENITLNLEPQILVNRAFLDKTSSYIKDGSKNNRTKDLHKVMFSDLIGIDIGMNAEINKWYLELNNNLSTLNYERILNAMRSSANLRKTLNKTPLDKIDVNLFMSYRYPAWNGTLGETEINSAYGGFLEKTANSTIGKINNNYNIRLGIANYKAEGLKSEDLISRSRTSFFASFGRDYLLWKEDITALNKKFVYSHSPVPIISKLSLSTNLTSSYFYYSDANNQGTIIFSAGPDLRLGNLSNNFLDYTKISIKPTVKVKSGSSPFKFDNSVDLKFLNIDLTQQIFGPLLFQSGININIDKGSENYGKVFGSKFSMMIHKRAYNFGLFYDSDQKAGGFSFRLNGFKATDLSEATI